MTDEPKNEISEGTVTFIMEFLVIVPVPDTLNE